MLKRNCFSTLLAVFNRNIAGTSVIDVTSEVVIPIRSLLTLILNAVPGMLIASVQG